MVFLILQTNLWLKQSIHPQSSAVIWTAPYLQVACYAALDKAQPSEKGYPSTLKLRACSARIAREAVIHILNRAELHEAAQASGKLKL